ncbi:reverse transcriptase domain, reverse transcriptase zinc-binding domain protein [Tanacetum coccineum]
MFTPRISALVGCDKSSRPDGYTAAFFKGAWKIVGSDVVNAVKEFFVNGKLLKELNHTVIALIPKIQNPTRINDFRPISCCNVLFKCISKIIANRIKGSLMHLISPNQSAFVPGRSIADNILLTHELMHNYHLDRGVARCAFKVDIQKAYDTVDWGFLKSVTIWYRGLRQGDPLSPYLFTMVMEVLTLILRRKIRSLPVKYLGVPLVPSLLVYKDCKELIEKAEGRINDWKNKSLSIAGKMRKGKSKVAWEDVCLPKNEGGLGVKRLDIFNKALMSSHIWKLLIRKDSCGPKWIHTYKLRNRNFGTFHFRGSRHGTVEKKSYNCVPVIREFNWDLHRVGLTTMSKVRDIIHDGSLSWPADLEFLRFGRLLDREMLRRLKTQDMLRSWDLSSSLNAGSCLLCSSQPDSHEHLFFECTRTSMSIVTKLILAASTYFIWQERNERLFNNQHRSANQVIECISASIRLNYFMSRFKRLQASTLLRRMKLPGVLIEQK